MRWRSAGRTTCGTRLRAEYCAVPIISFDALELDTAPFELRRDGGHILEPPVFTVLAYPALGGPPAPACR